MTTAASLIIAIRTLDKQLRWPRCTGPEAERFAANVMPIIRSIRTAEAATLADVANALNARGIKSATGGRDAQRSCNRGLQ